MKEMEKMIEALGADAAEVTEEDLQEIAGGTVVDEVACPNCGGHDFKVFRLNVGSKYETYRIFCKNCIKIVEVPQDKFDSYFLPKLPDIPRS